MLEDVNSEFLAEPPMQTTILLVDDRPEKILALESVLSDLGQEIVTARSGREALKILLQRDFAVILLDVEMPGMDGFETASLIRQRPKSEHTPILFVTSVNNSELHINRGYALGAVDYILSPIIPEILRTKVSVFVELWKKNEQLKRQAKLLQEKEARLNLSLAASETAVWHLDLAKNMICWTIPSASFVSDESLSYELKTTEFFELIHAEDRTTVEEQFARSLQLKLPVDTECRAKFGGIERVYRLRGQIMSSSTDGELSLLGVAMDLTVSKELERTSREALAATKAKDQFIAILSHELRTPLTPILMTVSALSRDSSLPPRVIKALEMIERNVQLESRLVDDLLDLNRIVHKKIDLQLEPIPLHQCIESALETAAGGVQKKNQKLILNLDATEDCIIGDKDRIQQVFWNIVQNATKFTPEGGTITIKSLRKEGKILVQIQDTGIGIESDALSSVFEAFQQGGPSIAAEFGGLGLGLAISKAILDAHGGKLTAASPGNQQGSVFTIELPLHIVDKNMMKMSSKKTAPALV